MPIRSNKVIPVTAALTLNRHVHDNRTVVVNAAAGIAITLQPATGSGVRYRIIIGTALSSGDVTVTTNGSDVYDGYALVEDSGDTTASDATLFPTSSATIFTFDQSAGSGNVGDWLEIEDFATAVWAVKAYVSNQTDPTTPFS